MSRVRQIFACQEEKTTDRLRLYPFRTTAVSTAVSIGGQTTLISSVFVPKNGAAVLKGSRLTADFRWLFVPIIHAARGLQYTYQKQRRRPVIIVFGSPPHDRDYLEAHDVISNKTRPNIFADFVQSHAELFVFIFFLHPGPTTIFGTTSLPPPPVREPQKRDNGSPAKRKSREQSKHMSGRAGRASASYIPRGWR